MTQLSFNKLLSIPQAGANPRILSPEDAHIVTSLLQKLDIITVEHFKLLETVKDNKVTQDDLGRFRATLFENFSTVLELFLQKHADLPAEQLEVVKTWKYNVRSNFLCLKYFADYAAFLMIPDQVFFGIGGLSEDFENIPQKVQVPYQCQATLLPYKNKIVWDGYIQISEADLPKSLKMQLLDLCKEAKRAGFIITDLSDYVQKQQIKEETPPVQP